MSENAEELKKKIEEKKQKVKDLEELKGKLQGYSKFIDLFIEKNTKNDRT